MALFEKPARAAALLAVFLLSATAIDLGGSPAPPPEPAHPENPGVHRARNRSALALRPRAYFFVGEEFPALDFEQAENARQTLGGYRLEVQAYDRDLRPAKEAARIGPYALVVRTVPEQGVPRRRCKTIYRLPGPIDPAWTPNLGDLEDFARRFGVQPSSAARARASLERIVRGRPFEKLAFDQDFVWLISGMALLSRSGGSHSVARPAITEWRQWWLDLLRELDGLDRDYPGPFHGPVPNGGPPAPVVRAGSPEEAGVRPDAAEKIDEVLRAWAADTDEAFAVCVVRHGVIVIHAAYGERDGQPMTVHTPSWMASVTKPMSGSLLMMLVDRGLVDLDAPIDRYLPPLRGIPLHPPLTARHLYTHVNGLERFPKWADEMPDLADRVAIYYPYLQVGRRWSYHGVGYMLGGKIVENVSGEALPYFYQRHLLAPLGMSETRVTGSHDDARSVPLDIARFGQMLLNRGAYGRWRFFRPETFQAMLPRALGSLLPSDPTRTHGIGLIEIDGGFIGHGARSTATFRIDLERDLVIVMTRNRMGRNQDKYHPLFLSAILENLDD
jgi:CubicO group peptidase (beta-lactamase class C family)